MTWNTPTAQCQGKTAYATKAGAIDVLQRIRKRRRGRRRCHKEKAHSVATLQPYRCTSCHHWHLGNPAEGKPRK